MSARDAASTFFGNARAGVTRWTEKIKGTDNKMSIEGLRDAYNVIQRYIDLQTRSQQDDQKVVEALKDMAEILVWGDQNNPSVFDFFLDKNLFVLFLELLNMKGVPYVKMQLLQCLNIIFENIRNESSLYYFMSNNYINNVITHKYDFSNEEILAYYISFMKTLSFRLSPSTISFFYNEHQEDFPLYSEAIKFFNHKESMVRIAVRTIVLNIFKVNDPPTRNFVGDEEQAPYFSNLVWFIGNQSIELDECVCNASHLKIGRLSDLLAEHLDVLHYVNDIFETPGIEEMCFKLANRLLDNMLVPLYVYSLKSETNAMVAGEPAPRISMVTSMILLAHVFSVFRHSYLLNGLAAELLKVSGVEELRRTLSLSRTPSQHTVGKGVDSGADSGTENERSTSDLATVTEGAPLGNTDKEKRREGCADTHRDDTQINGGGTKGKGEDRAGEKRDEPTIGFHERTSVDTDTAEAHNDSSQDTPTHTHTHTADEVHMPNDNNTHTPSDAQISTNNFATHVTAVLGGVTVDSPSGDDTVRPIATNSNGYNTPQNTRRGPPAALNSPFKHATVLSAPSSPALASGMGTPDAMSYRTPDTARSRLRRFGPPEKIIDSPVVSMERLNVNSRPTSAKDRSSRMAFSKGFAHEDAEGLEVTMTTAANVSDPATLSLSRKTSMTVTGNERLYRDAVLRAIDCEKDETVTLSALCFVYSIISSPLVDSNILTAARWLPKKRAIAEEGMTAEPEEPTIESSTARLDSSSPAVGNVVSEEAEMRSPRLPSSPSLSQSMFTLSTISYSAELVERAIAVLREGCKINSEVRQVTIHVAAKVIRELCYFEGTDACLRARHIQKLKSAHETAQSQVATLYRTHASAMILPMVEAEYQQKELRMQTVLMQPHILLPATNTPMTGIHLNYRIPNGEVERCRKAVHSFLLIRKLYLQLTRTAEDMLPLLAEVNEQELLNQQLDLNDADLMSCRVIQSDKPLGAHRFLVIDPERLIFVEPDKKQLGWGVVKVASDLQHVDITPDSGNHRVLHVVIQSPPRGYAPGTKNVLRVVFEDHLRAAAAS